MENNENGFVPENQTPQEGVYQQPAAEQPVYQYTYEQPAPQEAPKQGFGAAVDKVTSFAQNLDVNDLANKAKALPKKIWIMAGAALVVVIALIVLLCTTGNSYNTPIKAAEKLLKSTKVDHVIDRAPDILNGFGEKELRNIIKIAKKTDAYKDYEDDLEDGFAELLENIEDQYGKDYKIKIKVDSKDKIDKDDVEDYEDALHDFGKMVKKAAKAVNKLDDDIWEEAEDEIGLKESEIKDAIKQVESFGELCSDAKATAGYELDLVVTITGSELDEPEEQELTINVFKVNGRWIPDFVSFLPLSQLDRYVDNIGSLEAMLGSMF